MQCPSPYWSTPLTPEDRRINSKKKLFQFFVSVNFLRAIFFAKENIFPEFVGFECFLSRQFCQEVYCKLTGSFRELFWGK